MSRSNYDKPFYVDVGTSVVAIRCASNHDVVDRADHIYSKDIIKLFEETCDRMNREFELYANQRASSVRPKCDWSVKDALNFANTLANHGWTMDANSDAASSCIYALCRMLKEIGNPAALRNALKEIADICDGKTEQSPSEERLIIYNLAKAALAEPARNCDSHIHMQCVRCGKVIHLDCHFLDEINEHIEEHHGFTIICKGSILYGMCESCKKES